jgi:hypothetical protein
MTKTLKTYIVHFEVTNGDKTHLRGGHSVVYAFDRWEARRYVKSQYTIFKGERLRIYDVVQQSR